MHRVRIPKPGRVGKSRPICISTLEDKAPRQMVPMVLESVYKQGCPVCLRGIYQVHWLAEHKAAIWILGTWLHYLNLPRAPTFGIGHSPLLGSREWALLNKSSAGLRFPTCTACGVRAFPGNNKAVAWAAAPDAVPNPSRDSRCARCPT